jgi:hypothetical protein
MLHTFVLKTVLTPFTVIEANLRMFGHLRVNHPSITVCFKNCNNLSSPCRPFSMHTMGPTIGPTMGPTIGPIPNANFDFFSQIKN